MTDLVLLTMTKQEAAQWFNSNGQHPQGVDHETDSVLNTPGRFTHLHVGDTDTMKEFAAPSRPQMSATSSFLCVCFKCYLCICPLSVDLSRPSLCKQISESAVATTFQSSSNERTSFEWSYHISPPLTKDVPTDWLAEWLADRFTIGV
jgi:hypothetical protein